MEENKKTHFGSELVDEDEKKGRVRGVFDSAASRYDLMNDLLSLGTHRLWKRFLVKMSGLRPGDTALDVAGGTADIAVLMASEVGEEGTVVVSDINIEMLGVGRDKCIDRGLVGNVKYVQLDVEEIPFADNTFHCATIGFGIRNVTQIEKAFKEMTRVVKPGAKVLCLEFSRPTSSLVGRLYDIYSENLLPWLGERVAGERHVYVYLHESIRKFPDQETLKKIMEDAGLYNVRYHNLFNGIAVLHLGYKV